MYVYLRWCDGIKRTPKVSLNLRRCMPVVRTYSEGRIDPALWFKVLVLNSVLIDIDRRKVFWTCKNPDDSSKFRNYHEEQVAETQKFVDFFSTQEEITSISDCDNFEYDTRAAELYGTARGIYTNLSMEVFDKEGNVSTYEDLLKILHVFILPEVKFHLKDRHSIQAVLDQMENECQMVESLINRKITEKRFYEDSLGRQRKSLIKTGLLLGHLNNINTEEDFYKLLLKHLDKDVKRLEDNIVSLTDRIVHLKKYSSESEHCEYKLQQARETRSKYLKDKEKLLMTKEELFQQTLKHEKDLRKSRTFLRRSKSLPKKKKIVSSYSVYVNESKLLDAVSDEIRSLINSKIKLSGMREAVHLTVSEIDGDGVSYGFNRKHGAFEAEADMFDPRKKPDDWMTLREQVQDFLNSDRSETRTRHDKFCDSVKRKCGKLLAGSHGRCSDGGSLSSSTGSHMSKMSKRYTVRWLHGNVSKEECEKLCMEVSEYILDTAHIMSVEIQGRDTEMITYHTHVYICYEKHVADDIMAELSNVFKESFRDICEQLYAWIATYSMTELEFINKLMSQLFPDDSDRDTKFVNPTGSLPRYTPGFMTGVTENGGNLRGLARISKSLEHLPLSTLVDKLHEQTGNLAITFEKAWSVISSEGDATKSLKSLYKDDKIYSSFSEFFTLIHTEIKTNSIFDKLRHLSRAVQIVESRAQHLFKLNGHKSDMTTDDLLDILILLVCKLDPNSLLCLYADLNLIFHLTPSFLQGSMSQYCVTTLTGAYQHLFERQDLLMASRETNA